MAEPYCGGYFRARIHCEADRRRRRSRCRSRHPGNSLRLRKRVLVLRRKAAQGFASDGYSERCGHHQALQQYRNGESRAQNGRQTRRSDFARFRFRTAHGHSAQAGNGGNLPSAETLGYAFHHPLPDRSGRRDFRASDGSLLLHACERRPAGETASRGPSGESAERRNQKVPG